MARLALRGGGGSPADHAVLRDLEAELLARAAARARDLSRDLPSVLASYRISPTLVGVLTAEEARVLVLVAERAGVAPPEVDDLSLDLLESLAATTGLRAVDVARDVGAPERAVRTALQGLRADGLATLADGRWYATNLGATVVEARAARFRVRR